MSKLLIFSGTSDGRILAEKLAAAGHEITVCVATEYGEQVMPENPNIKVHCGRMDEAHMHAFMSSLKMDIVIDATHPYASAVSENIRRVCLLKKYVYYRLVRNSLSGQIDMKNVSFVDNTLEAAKLVETMEGNIFISTGSKELPVFLENVSNKGRLYVRVLPSVSVLEELNSAGLLGKQIICMQGPFSEELNYAMFVQTNSKILVTKESGSAGGFMEKISAAKRADMKIVIIRRPEETGLCIEEILEKFGVENTECAGKTELSGNVEYAGEAELSGNAEYAGEAELPENSECAGKTELSDSAEHGVKTEHVGNSDMSGKNGLHKKITLVGIGMGSVSNMTVEACNACQNAELIIGANRMLSAVPCKKNVRKVSLYQADKIAETIAGAEEKNIVIALSGDVGFYSGAKKLLIELEKKGCEDVDILPGISTVVYLSSKAGLSWEDMAFVSLHGRSQNILEAVKYNEKVFALLGGTDGISKLCKLLCDNNLAKVKVLVGTNLSYENEKIFSEAAEDLCNYKDEGVSAVIITNENAVAKNTTHGIADENFLRDKVPMTKEEVRTVSLSKLQLKENSVVYDIGAGSGSVSIECALRAPAGRVYAIERKDEAVNLIRKNCRKFGVSNVEIIKAYAPDIDKETDEKLPAPTHAFIGGSGGNLSAILDWLKEKNPDVRVVINAIALETVAEIMNEIKKRNIDNADIVCMNISKSKKIGNYNMMMGNNPVYVISFK